MPPFFFRKNYSDYIERIIHPNNNCIFEEEETMFMTIMQVVGAMIFAGYIAYKVAIVGNKFTYEPKHTELSWTEYVAWKQMKRT